MRSTIHDVLYCKKGNVNNIPQSEEYKEALKQFHSVYDKLEATLNDEQKNLLNDLYFSDGLVMSEIEITFFEEGFKLATKLITDGLK